MIRPDWNVFDSAIRASPAKASAVMHINSRAASTSATPTNGGGGAIAFSDWRRTDSWSSILPHSAGFASPAGGGGGGGGGANGGHPLSSSCPRTPVSMKKRKDSGSTPAGHHLQPHSLAYRRELERRLLDGDYLIFQYRPQEGATGLCASAPSASAATSPALAVAAAPTTTGASTATSFSPNTSRSVSADMAIDSNGGSSSGGGGTVTLGSLLNVSGLLLSSQGPRDSLFSASSSPQPSPALHGHIGPPRSPLGAHAISSLLGPAGGGGGGGAGVGGVFSSGSHAKHHPLPGDSLAAQDSLLPLSLAGLSNELEQTRSPSPELDMAAPQKRALTAQQWIAHQAANATPTVALTLPHQPQQQQQQPTPTSLFQVPTGSLVPPHAHHHRRGGAHQHGSGGESDYSSLSDSLSASAASSAVHSGFASGAVSTSESVRGSFSAPPIAVSTSGFGSASESVLSFTLPSAGSGNLLLGASQLNSPQPSPQPSPHTFVFAAPAPQQPRGATAQQQQQQQQPQQQAFSPPPPHAPDAGGTVVGPSGSFDTNFTLRTRRRNNSNPTLGLVVRSSTEHPTGKERGGLLRPPDGRGETGPIAAFNVFARVEATQNLYRTPPSGVMQSLLLQSQQAAAAAAAQQQQQAGDIDDASTSVSGSGGVTFHMPPVLHGSHSLPQSHVASPALHGVHPSLGGALHVVGHSLQHYTGPLPTASPSSAGALPPIPASLPSVSVSAVRDFDWHYLIGRGSFGEVWKVARKTPPTTTTTTSANTMADHSNATQQQQQVPAQEVYAIKKHLKPLETWSERRSFLRRSELLKQLVDAFNNIAPPPPPSSTAGQSSSSASASSAASLAPSPLCSPFSSPAHTSFGFAVHQQHSAGGALQPSQSTTNAAGATATASVGGVGYQWPPNLLIHHLVWQESSVLYTATEYCALGDLFQFFNFGARMPERQTNHQQQDQQQQMHTDMASVHPSSSVDPLVGDEDDAMGVVEVAPRTSSTGSTGDLASWVPPETRDLTEEDLVQVLHQMAGVLIGFHKAGVLHNDLKPANIYACRTTTTTTTDDADSYPFTFKLGDLGSMVSLHDWVDGDSEGDGSYLAPEALNPTWTTNAHGARVPKITAKADIYALGVSLVTLITGARFESTMLRQSLALARAGLMVDNSYSEDGGGGGRRGSNSSMHDVSIASAVAAATSAVAQHRPFQRPAALGIHVQHQHQQDTPMDETEYATPIQRHRGHSHTLSSGTSHRSASLSATVRRVSSLPPRSAGVIGSLSASTSQDDLASLRVSVLMEGHSAGGFSEAQSPIASPTGVTRAAERSDYTSPLRQIGFGNIPSAATAAAAPAPATYQAPRPDNELNFDPSRDVVGVSPALAGLLRRMVSVYPGVRPSAEEIREWTTRELRRRQQMHA